jgi:hypothetical protein
MESHPLSPTMSRMSEEHEGDNHTCDGPFPPLVTAISVASKTPRMEGAGSEYNTDAVSAQQQGETHDRSPTLTSFLSQLLEERHFQQHNHNGTDPPTSVALVSDNAHAHPCHLRLIRTDSFLQAQSQIQPHHHHGEQKSRTSDIVDVGDYASIHYEEKKEEEDVDAISHETLKQEAREEESSTTVNIRTLQRPCRWSSDDSLSNSMLPNSPPTKTDYLPTCPRRRNSRDMFPDDMYDSSSTTSSSSCSQRQELPSSGKSEGKSLQQSTLDVLALLEREEHPSLTRTSPTSI